MEGLLGAKQLLEYVLNINIPIGSTTTFTLKYLLFMTFGFWLLLKVIGAITGDRPSRPDGQSKKDRPSRNTTEYKNTSESPLYKIEGGK
jgi:hypothetical protein